MCVLSESVCVCKEKPHECKEGQHIQTSVRGQATFSVDTQKFSSVTWVRWLSLSKKSSAQQWWLLLWLKACLNFFSPYCSGFSAAQCFFRTLYQMYTL